MDCLASRKKFKKNQPAWTDPNDQVELADELGVLPDQPDIVSEEQPSRDSHGEASSSSSDSDDDGTDMHAADVRSKKLTLEATELRYKHLVNVNNDLSYRGAVKVVKFHPKSKIALVASAYGQANLFEVDGERNRYLQNIKLPNTKKPFCLFKESGDTVVMSSRDYNGAFFTYNMVSSNVREHKLKVGKDRIRMDDFILHGDFMACRSDDLLDVHVLSSKTYENKFSLKLNEPAKAIKFDSNNNIIIAGGNSRVYIWDVRKTSLCKHKFTDQGTVHITSLDLSDSSKCLSIGSDCGIVNSYEMDECLTNNFPAPIRTFCNLKTPINTLLYNSTGELLVMGTHETANGLRLVHTLSGTVYKNFPVPRRDYKHLYDCDFSPLSGYLGLGSSSGRAHLVRIPYYKSY